jgi:sulfite exporter TauE/SafE
MTSDYLAFFMGLFGSLHCVAMCGPLLLALPTVGENQWTKAKNRLLYQIGRILTYGVIGLFIGFIGIGISMKGWQQVLSITTGGALILIALFHFIGTKNSSVLKIQQKLLAPLIKQMGYWLHKPGGSFMTGVLNGILPCGMVYMALATALNTGSAINGARFMVLFGLGTLPLLLLTAVAGNFIKSKIPFRLSAWLPFLFLVMGSWFILRGANLDIPFLSPLIYPSGMILCE